MTEISTRTEVDLLGEMQVSNDVWYGIHTLRAMHSFDITGRKVNSMPEIIQGMVLTKKAAALANREMKVISQEKADAIVAACDDVLTNGVCMDQFPSDIIQGGAGTSINMNTNEVIANLALERLGYEKGRYDIISPADDVNMSQSTNDAYATGVRLGLYKQYVGMREAVARLEAVLRGKATEFADVIKMGRTQLQDAVPMTLGQEFQAWADLLEQELTYLDNQLASLLSINLGGTAIGTGVNAPAGYREAVTKHLREITGWNIVSAPNLIAATSDCSPFVAAHGAYKHLAVKLSKTCNDLRLLSAGPRAGIKEINLPEMQAGSSIMPAKVNPVIPEAVNQVCFKVFGNDYAVTFGSEASQLQLNVLEPVIVQCLYESASWLSNAMDDLGTKCVAGITANADKTHQMVMESIGLVTYLNPVLGHHAGDQIGAECARTGKTVREVVLERGLLTEAELDDLLSTENLMHPVYKGKIYE